MSEHPKTPGGRRRADVAPDSPSTVEMDVIKRRADSEPLDGPTPPASSRTRSDRPRRNRLRAGGVNPLLALAVLLPLLTAGTLLLVQPEPTGVERTAPRSMPLESATLVCPVETPSANVSSPDSSGTVTGGSPVTLSAGRVVTVAGPVIVGESTAAPGLVAALEDRGAALTCAAPRFDQWFAGLGAGAEHQSTLVITNPDSGAAVADLALHGPEGLVNAPGLRGVSVAGHSTVTVNLAERAPNADDLAVQVRVTRGRLGVAVKDSWTDIESQRTDTDWVTPQVAPAAEVRLLGLGAGRGTRTLTVLNPSTSQARVSLEAISAESEFAPTEAPEITLAPGQTRTVDISAVLGNPSKSGVSGVRVRGTQPVVAGVTSVIGKELVRAAPVQPLGELGGGLPLGEGSHQLVLVGAPAQGSVAVTTRDAQGQVLKETTVEVAPGRGQRLDLGKARWVSVKPQAAVASVGGAVLVGDEAVLALWPFVTQALVPSVRQALN